MEEKKIEVIYSEDSEENIYHIIQYIIDKGYPETAEKFAIKLYAFGDSLAVFPEKYPICRFKKFAKRKLRCAVFEKNHIFIYKVVNTKLIIYNVLHCKRLKN